MGRKFASIHILNSNIEEVLIRLGRCREDHQTNSSNSNLKTSVPNKLASVLNVIQTSKPLEATFYLTEVNGSVSVYSEYFKTQVIKEHVKNWFIWFDKYVLSVDYFDDEFLDINIFKKYKFETSLVDGLSLNDYGLNKTRFDPEKICEIFNVHPVQVEQAYCQEDIFKTCNNFAELFHLPLTLSTFDAMNSEQFQFEKETFYLGFSIG
ncbi:hypothetical protein ABES02_08505 [Neobacillus pocheonensis]|uniref:hypothetical protein n=1 Tax=Neobacillus pocheonensis TaxID=363869 RepID=UPI003D2D0DAB